MALNIADRVKESSTSTGTGTLTLGGAVSGFQSFATIGNGNQCYYTIVHNSLDEWEVGVGTYTASGTTLSRDTVLDSSSGGAKVSFSVGNKEVFVTYPADRSVSQADIGTAPNEIPLNQYLGSMAYQDAENIAGDVGVGGSVSMLQMDAGNVRAVNNTVSATNTNGALSVLPNGSGALLLNSSVNTFGQSTIIGGGTHIRVNADNNLEVFGPNTGTGVRLFARNDAGTLNRLELQGGQVIFPLTTGADGLYFDASSGNLGLGATPSAWFSNAKAIDIKTFGSVYSENSYFGAIGMSSNANWTGGALTDWVYKNSGTATRYEQHGAAGVGAHAWYTAPSGTAGNAITFTQAMTLDAAGHLIVPAGITLGTTAGTYNAANTLDDYEEGTFNPTVIGTASAGTVTYGAQFGKYTKVGRLVTVEIYLSWSGGTGTGNMAFSGLPFSIGSNAYGSASIWAEIGLATSNYLTTRLLSGGTTIDPFNQPVGGGFSSPVTYQAGGVVMITATYSV